MSIPPNQSPFAPSTPKKIILWIFTLGCIGASFMQLSGFSLLKILGLSRYSLINGYIWTLFTYPFTIPSNRLIDLIFPLSLNLIFIWLFGSNLIDRMRQVRFLFFFLGSIFSSALLSLPFFLFFNDLSILSGPQPVLLSFICAWTLLHAKEEFQFNISLGFRPFWIFLIFIFLNLFFDLPHLPLFFSKIGAILFSYFFCLISEKSPSTLPFLKAFERNVLRTIEKIHSHKKMKGSKIIDFQTGKPVLNDEQFIDTMLAQISLHGEESLTMKEKERMRQISEKKRMNKF